MQTLHRKVIIVSSAIVLIMFAFSFALSPLYNAICNNTNFYAGQKIPPGTQPDFSRDITVQFVATNNHELPWDFFPQTVNVNVHPNENVRVVFFAKNRTDHTMTVQAIPSFSPSSIVKNFHKTACFCFNQQTLKAGESMNMPLVFHIDEDLPRDVQTITLSYTLFDVTSKKIIQRIAQ